MAAGGPHRFRAGLVYTTVIMIRLNIRITTMGQIAMAGGMTKVGLYAV